MSSQRAQNGATQAELEARAEKLSAANEGSSKNLQEVYGSLNDWLLEIGPCRLILIPFQREWWCYDEPHREWRFTGKHIGEVRFVIDGKQLTVQNVQPAVPNPAAAPAKPPAARTTTAVRRFCPLCGTPVGAAWKFCQSCGEALPPP